MKRHVSGSTHITGWNVGRDSVVEDFQAMGGEAERLVRRAPLEDLEKTAQWLIMVIYLCEVHVP